MFHADRGTQFTSEQLWEVCRNLRVRLWLTGLRWSITLSVGAEALGMVSPVDFENHITYTGNEEEIAA